MLFYSHRVIVKTDSGNMSGISNYSYSESTGELSLGGPIVTPSKRKASLCLLPQSHGKVPIRSRHLFKLSGSPFGSNFLKLEKNSSVKDPPPK